MRDAARACLRRDADDGLSVRCGGESRGQGNADQLQLRSDAEWLYRDDAIHRRAEWRANLCRGWPGNWLRSNVYAAGAPLATYDTNGLHFNLSDALGTKRVQVNATGVVEETCQSLPFGDQLSCTGPGADANKLHFTAKERDTESGNDYFGARYLSSNVGRFLSPDWSKNPQGVPYADFSNPQSLNLYAYVNNNPLSSVDLDGHSGSCSDNPGLCASIRDSVAEGGSIAAGTAAFNSLPQNNRTVRLQVTKIRAAMSTGRLEDFTQIGGTDADYNHLAYEIQSGDLFKGDCGGWGICRITLF